MTHASVSASRADGVPVLLFTFTYSGGTFHRSTALRPITVLGNTYTPLAISAGQLESRGDLEPDGQIIPINLEITDTLVQLYVDYPPSEPVDVEVREHHLGQTEAPLLWLGEISDLIVNENDANLKLAPVTEFFADDLGERTWSLLCPHTLYDADTCRASKAAATVTAVVDSIGGNTVNLPANWHGSFQFFKFTRGEASWTNAQGATEIRRITATSATSVVLTTDPRDLLPGATITLALSCNRRGIGGDCELVHNNIVNFGGHPWISLISPSDESVF